MICVQNCITLPDGVQVENITIPIDAKDILPKTPSDTQIFVTGKLQAFECLNYLKMLHIPLTNNIIIIQDCQNKASPQKTNS